ncbi:hypothetical protein COR51_23760 [Vibrio mediterranei]|uniref:Uncharacterized protein n=1 Tax=Vibrio mediterranei TaxID=689 RepID=A0ABX5D900_9VIBR|nr:hypothetical protein COR51_23760 [Vibrio mediterranei]
MSQINEKEKKLLSSQTLPTPLFLHNGKNKPSPGTSVFFGWFKLSFCRGSTKIEASSEFCMARQSSSAAILKLGPTLVEKIARLVLIGIGTAVVKTMLTLIGIPPF